MFAQILLFLMLITGKTEHFSNMSNLIDIRQLTFNHPKKVNNYNIYNIYIIYLIYYCLSKTIQVHNFCKQVFIQETYLQTPKNCIVT